MNVLIVDDEPIELEQLEFLVHLHFPTWNVSTALYGSEAIKMAENKVMEDKTFQLVLMDIKLPGTNGLDVATKLKTIMPKLEIVIISAFQDFEYAKRSIHLSVLDYIVKPVIEKELVDTIQKFLKIYPEYDNYKEEVQKVIQEVKMNFNKQMKLSEIAKDLHLNANYLSSLFRQEIGMSFSEFLLQYRIEHAMRLLIQDKNLSILNIADASGFNSQQYFSNVFKRKVGCTPREYQKRELKL